MILERLFDRGERRAPQQERRNNWWESGIYLGETASGVTVTPDSALTNSAVFACVRILAETVATLPLITYERQGDARRRATDFYLYPILHDEPNEWMTSFEYRETVQGHLALWGNAYSQIDYDEAGRAKSIFPLRPDRMQRIEINGGVKKYLYQLPTNEMAWLPGVRIWHLKAFGDGTFGYSPIELMKSGIGLAMALEKYGSKFFGNGARPGGVLEHPGKLGDEAQTRLRESWSEMHSGLDNAHKVAILEEGLKWHEVGIPPEHAQFLETRKYQVTDIARMFRIQPHKIADLEKSTNNNIEHQGLEFVTDTMVPWLTRWEQSIKKYLLLPDERERYYVEFLVDGLLRGDTASRTAYYATGRQWGWLSTNDIRTKENMNPIEGGDEYLTPMNMMVVGTENEPAQDNQETGDEAAGIRELERRQERETRARAQAGGRFRLSMRQQRVFEDIARRILRRERNDVSRQIKKMIGNGPSMLFERWLDEFYKEHAVWSAEQMTPSMQTYAEMVADKVADELGKDDLSGRTKAFMEAYTEEFGRRESSKSVYRMKERLAESKDLPAEELQADLEAEMDDWLETRPGAIGHEESVRANNAVALALYGQLGIEKIMSVATGESDCPYCEALDGQVIGINQYFLNEGQSFSPEGAQAPLNVSQNMRQAPYHAGCDCVVVSG